MAKRFTVTIYNPINCESASASSASMNTAFNCALACLKSRENDNLAIRLFGESRKVLMENRNATRASAFHCLDGFGVEIERFSDETN